MWKATAINTFRDNGEKSIFVMWMLTEAGFTDNIYIQYLKMYIFEIFYYIFYLYSKNYF